MKKLKQEGYLNRDNWRLSRRERRRGFRPMRAKPNRLDHLLEHLRREQKLPVIYFAFGRKRTVSLAEEASRFDFLTNEERKTILEKFDQLLERYDLTQEVSAEELRPLIKRGIAYHHAGMLPTLPQPNAHLRARMVDEQGAIRRFRARADIPPEPIPERSALLSGVVTELRLSYWDIMHSLRL